MWKQALGYGVLLAGGTFALQWLDYVRLARLHAGDLYVFIIAAAFLGLGLVIGARVFGGAKPATGAPGNLQAVSSLGISPSELTVLKEIAAGRSNKEIALRLKVSPNTIKTHVAHLFHKLGARRRTEAIKLARELGIMP